MNQRGVVSVLVSGETVAVVVVKPRLLPAVIVRYRFSGIAHRSNPSFRAARAAALQRAEYVSLTGRTDEEGL